MLPRSHLVISRRTLLSVLAMVIALLMAFIPWESLKGELFVDKTVYTNYFMYETNRLDYIDLTRVTDFVTNEVLWHFLVRELIETWNLPLSAVFFGISALIIYCYSTVILRNTHAIAVLLLLNPLVIDFAFSQFRLALAVSLLCIAFFAQTKLPIRAILATSAAFIHTASLLFFAVFIFSEVLSRFAERERFSARTMWWFSIGFGIAISLTTGPLRESLLGFFGDRRAEYAEISSSILYSSFWIFLGAVLFYQRRDFYLSKANIVALVILGVIAANMLTGGYSTRFLSAGFPFLICAIFSVRQQARRIVLAVFVMYTVAQWFFWFAN